MSFYKYDVNGDMIKQDKKVHEWEESKTENHYSLHHRK